ncbi:MAG TPA: TIGR01777 family oxidoreductase [Acidimicrobiales bacterium]|nr:TIGR01777 family oxidoreductase [Acidimicrobiales bacterium]
MRVLLTGSSGLVGSALTRALEADGHHVTRLVRRPPASDHEIRWDPARGAIDSAALEGHDAAVNLAGAGIGDRRWTARHKAAIRESRVQGTGLLARALASLDRPPAVLASGSAVGFYGNRGDEELTEESGPGTGFLADVVREWEAATAPARQAGIRVATFRSGVVLSTEGGALRRQLLPFRAGVGGRLGSGEQWFSWISIGDEVGAIRHILGNADIEGPVNLTAPGPVTNAQFTRALGRALRRPTVLPTPTVALWVLFGREMVAEMLLTSHRVLPAVLTASGYSFRHPAVDAALGDLLAKPRQGG